jgi:hypothetical protein
VKEAYRSCIKQIQLSGPRRYVSPVINRVATIAEAHQDESQYFILLIITDGIFDDLSQTKKVSISDNSYLRKRR